MESVNIESMGPVAPVLPSLGITVVKEATSAPPTMVDTYTVIPSSSVVDAPYGAWLLRKKKSAYSVKICIDQL